MVYCGYQSIELIELSWRITLPAVGNAYFGSCGYGVMSENVGKIKVEILMFSDRVLYADSEYVIIFVCWNLKF